MAEGGASKASALKYRECVSEIGGERLVLWLSTFGYETVVFAWIIFKSREPATRSMLGDEGFAPHRSMDRTRCLLTAYAAYGGETLVKLSLVHCARQRWPK
jgi:hypothetical protein